MAANSSRINFKIKTFVDRPAVMKRINRWQLGQLARIGAYARGAMKKQIRPALKGRGKAAKTVTVYPQAGDLPESWRGDPFKPIECLVPSNGPVVRVGSGKRVPRAIGLRARMLLRHHLKGQGEGKPPRRGPTDKLRRHIYFSVDVEKKSVVIGPEPFPSQPRMRGRVSVPELLNKGGVEILLGEPVKYGPRPFVETILKPAIKKLKENIRKKPVR